ncbi:hypothetical protein COX24_01465 [bacterium (Candidatus Gribaldobacteria) CG23_combo_of_CG06-09_8_20_14_all_37_87_8]|uniref:Type II toxin-antitoxin system HicA family toxin n=2 Tax=Candidatus Gribaldobacteria TaxID=2798536 RepID=A0A2G9ZF80_9BACT|nr:MAG: hypothetical protein COX24_01465 [bacterium (Candidatus Gribaldobacteria) CG23_combo_of_CG06-09_8_20_14_all_37_87_8]PIR90663.1 MAG: type II toxin-antitoxin system HicA family toxin [bacterium (Candidatus Gribaldobacteria) CG10_big_fil_rev_8_21_14_0_10_37_21]
MPKLFSSKQIIKVLQKHGFILISQCGSHVKFRKMGLEVRTTIVPDNKKEIPRGTFKSILRQSGLEEKDF